MPYTAIYPAGVGARSPEPELRQWRARQRAERRGYTRRLARQVGHRERPSDSPAHWTHRPAASRSDRRASARARKLTNRAGRQNAQSSEPARAGSLRHRVQVPADRSRRRRCWAWMRARALSGAAAEGSKIRKPPASTSAYGLLLRFPRRAASAKITCTHSGGTGRSSTDGSGTIRTSGRWAPGGGVGSKLPLTTGRPFSRSGWRVLTGKLLTGVRHTDVTATRVNSEP